MDHQSAVPGKLFIQLIDTHGTVTVRPFRGSTLSIGRAVENEISLQSWPMSRHHARLTMNEDESVTVMDLASKNGVHVNGQRIDPSIEVPITTEDSIVICDFQLRLLPDEHAHPIQHGPETPSPFRESTMVDVVDASEIRSQLLAPSTEAPESGTAAELGIPTTEFLLAAFELLDTKDVAAVSQSVLDFVHRVIGFTAGYVLTWDEIEETAEIEAARSNLSAGTPPAISRSIIRDAVKTRQPVLLLDAQSDTRYDSAQSIIGLGIRTAIAAPMITADGAVLSIIYVIRLGDSRQYTSADARVLHYVASVAAMRFQNAKLHEEALRTRFMAGELSVGAKIQEDLLPRTLPAMPGFEITRFYQPCRIMGGDFYDCRLLNDGRLYLYLGDVSGKGVGAAMLMFSVVTVLRTLHIGHSDRQRITGLLTAANRALTQTMSQGKFASAWAGFLDADASEVCYSNAAQPAMVIRTCGEVELLPSHGTPLGLFEEMEYQDETLKLESGDILFLYSDGLTEARSPDGAFFGQAPLTDLMSGLRELSTAEISDRIQETFSAFVGDAASADDMTYLLIKKA